VLATSIGYLFNIIGFPEANIVILYLVAVLVIARLTNGYIWGIIGSLISTAAFNYFFALPMFSLTVDDPSYLITFAIMTIVSIITSTLTSRVKQSALEAQENEAQTKAVYSLTNLLTDANDLNDIASISVDVLSELMHTSAQCLCFNELEEPDNFYIRKNNDKIEKIIVDDIDDVKHLFDGNRAGFIIGNEYYEWPIYGSGKILGIIRIPSNTAEKLNDIQRKLLRSMIESIALAMDRFHSTQLRIKSREETIQERYRGNLLRAISHDLRTPLSAIIGTSEMLIDMSAINDPRYKLATDIHSDAEWLHSLVENILSLTRLQDGKLVISKEKEAVEEVVGGIVVSFAKRNPEYEINVDIPSELLIVPMDARLITQVLTNLVDNAIKHTSPGNLILIRVSKDDINASFSVIDNGEGISISDLPNIFQMFYTTHTKHSDAIHGIGLGLAICDAIIKAHGGTIEAKNREDGNGSEFTFKLPLN
ncbi:MAG: DUF4118 domain-containing protein, partial [Erysipelotrichaceae bacterium]